MSMWKIEADKFFRFKEKPGRSKSNSCGNNNNKKMNTSCFTSSNHNKSLSQWYAEKLVFAKRESYRQTLESVRLSSNNFILVLSFCFLLEATLFAGIMPSQLIAGFSERYFIAFVFLLMTNLFLVSALFLAITANLGGRTVAPAVSDYQAINIKSNLIEHWLIMEYAIIESMREDTLRMLEWLSVARVLLASGVVSGSLTIISILVLCSMGLAPDRIVEAFVVCFQVVIFLLIAIYCIRRLLNSRLSQDETRDRVQSNYILLAQDLHGDSSHEA